MLATKYRGKPCSTCNLPHFSTRLVDDRILCAPCEYADIVLLEKKGWREVIDFIREKGLCAYCGEYGNEIEHVVPRTSRLPTYTVLACGECNRLASGQLFSNFEDKAGFIKLALKRKYAEVLKMPEWTEDELEEMGYQMRRDIKARQLLKQVTTQRITWDWLAEWLKSTQ